jgi:hypothetical protein
MGYANQLVRLEFPDLSEEGDPIFVTIRNPKTLPLATMTPKDVEVDANGQPTDPAAAIEATYELMASIVHDWHVYDAANPNNTQPLPLPATVEHFRVLPMDIISRFGEALKTVTVPPQSSIPPTATSRS